MAPAPTPPSHPRERLRGVRPVERFKPTTGQVVGWCGVALAVVTIGYVVLAEHSVTGLRLALGALFGGVAVYVTQLRPRAAAYPEDLVLRGTVRDTFLPLRTIDEVTMGQTLNVFAEGRRHVCVGIGRSIGYDVRQRVRAQGTGSLFGPNRSYQFTGRPELNLSRQRQTSYHEFVLTRITDLVAAAGGGRRARGTERPPVQHVWALPELAALVLTALAFLASLLL